MVPGCGWIRGAASCWLKPAPMRQDISVSAQSNRFTAIRGPSSSRPMGLHRNVFGGNPIPFSLAPIATLGKIRVDRGRVFTGRVLEVDGKPCRNAKVTYSVTGRRNNPIGPEQHVKTDSEGRFRTLPMPVGELYLWITAPERRLAWVTRSVQPGGEEALEPFHLERDVPIQGIVKDEHGRPVVGAAVQCQLRVYRRPPTLQGRFTIHGFGPKPHFQLQLPKMVTCSSIGA